MLSPEQIQQYTDNGYLVVPNLLSEQEADDFVQYEATQDPEWRNHLDNHKRDEHWAHVAKHSNIVQAIRQLQNSPKPMIVQTMYLEKRPAEPGKGTALHQDNHYLPNDPTTLMACWLAMSNTDGENGGLCVVPGSHRQGLYETHKATNSKDHQVWETEHLMRDRTGKEWKQRFYSFEIDGLDKGAVVNLEVPKGAGVFFSSYTIHGSYGNRSPNRVRRAFATHFVSEGTWVLRADVQNVVPAV
jgi:phytanoyl-CoA hydroxylase